MSLVSVDEPREAADSAEAAEATPFFQDYEVTLFSDLTVPSEPFTRFIANGLVNICRDQSGASPTGDIAVIGSVSLVRDANAPDGLKIYLEGCVGNANDVVRVVLSHLNTYLTSRFSKETASKQGMALPEIRAILDAAGKSPRYSVVKREWRHPRFADTMSLTLAPDSDIDNREMDNPPPLTPDQGWNRTSLAELLDVARQAVDGNGDVAASDWDSQLVDRFAQAESERLKVVGEISLRAEQIVKAQHRLTELVEEARSAGFTWSVIGQAAGISPQAAHRRWDPDARKKHSDYRRQKRSRATTPDESGS